ncbi:hypothetical protein SAMN05192574_106204 [Mucilaginibacter gossypiicola]|uniref:SGNH hydrolase-like domain-containing protein, acetyltransferase AlgX n=1 Tax=Mucilaginibacter gossypiicola TaxID=551995 RepID=A0A1H8N285_9SPHI|nr:hypothetical protein [Mucilaginibacter gossypiicola]SEO23629.1 hypothetical protein SAMN05192574_106204 [Mucilaginibacter gossypiicola]
MRKITALLILIVSIVLLGSSMNQSFVTKIKFEKYFDHLNPQSVQESALFKAAFVHSDKWDYGDLYGVSFLPQYKFKLEPFKEYPYKPGRKSTNKVLYIIGDSYLADKTLSGAFDAFDNVIFLDRRFGFGPIKLDTTKQNYLIMEFSERNLNGYDIDKTFEIRWTTNDIRSAVNVSNKPLPGGPPLPHESIFERLGRIIFHKDLSRNLELILFDNKLATPFKEAKASLNYQLFDRVANEVVVSTDKKRLLFNTTIDTSSVQSAFRPKTEHGIDSIINNLDIAKNYYLSIGFKKVFLSVIPNPVSVYDDKRMPYNHLLERVEQKTDLTVIPLYNIFKADNRNLFYRSDSHWNPQGLDTWVNEANKVLTSSVN